MATTKAAGPISADRLKSFIERVEKLEEERKAIGGDVKDVYSEAKGVGYDVATMRKIVALRAKDPADRAEAETLLDTYCHALGMVYVSTGYDAAQPSEDDLMEQAGRIADEVDRCMALVRSGKLPKIEDIKRLIGCSNGKAQKLRGMIATRLEQFSRLSPQTRENPKPEDGDDGITDAAGRFPGEQGDDNAPLNVRVPEADRGSNREDGARASGGEGVQRRAGFGTAGGAGQDLHDSGASVERDVGECGDHAPAGRDAAPAAVEEPGALDLPNNEVQPSATPSVGAVAAEPRVAPPFLGDDPGEPPPFLLGPSPANRRVA